MMLTSLLLLQFPEADDPRRIFVAGPKEAYYLEPPEAISKPFVRRLIWSADGSSLLVERLVPPSSTPPLVMANALQDDDLQGVMQLHPRVQVVAWGTRSRFARTLLDVASDRVSIENIEPLSGTDQAFIATAERPVRADGTLGPTIHSYALLSASSGTIRRVWSGEQPLRYQLAPKRAIGVVYLSEPREPQRVALFGTDGKLGSPLSLPAGARFGFSQAGQPGAMVAKTGPNGRRIGEFRLLDSRTGAIGAVATQQFFGKEEAPPLRAFAFRSRGKRENLEGIMIAVERGRTKEPTDAEVGIVTTDGSLPSLSPTNNAVAYVSGHGAFVRPLVKVSRKEYDDAMLEAEKQKAMRYGRQMGMALSMYSMDADDAFPPLGGDGKEVVYPYLKNRSALDAFTYTFGGGTVKGNPSETELGYISGPGGRAVVYADGTVKWLPDGV